MTDHEEVRDPEEDRALGEGGMGLVERVKLVVGTLVSIGILFGMVAGLWVAMNQQAQASEHADVARLEAADAAQSKRMDRLVDIVEVMAILESEPVGSPERAAALDRLRSMRRVVTP